MIATLAKSKLHFYNKLTVVYFIISKNNKIKKKMNIDFFCEI